MITIKKGLDIPISGAPDSRIEDSPGVSEVAILGQDYIGMRPTMHVRVGDQVKKGQVLFSDKKKPGVNFTAIAGGEITAINRGEKRVLQSVVIRVAQTEEEMTFAQYEQNQLSGVTEEQVRQNLIDSGMWTCFRTRPFSRTPEVDARTRTIFVNMMDTNPLAADPMLVIEQRKEDFLNGLELVAKLADETLFLCKAPDAKIEVDHPKIKVESFAGPHPAGLPGTHIHFLAGASIENVVWSIDYQDVIAIGRLFVTGKLDCERVIALAGPQVKSPCLIRTRMGANVTELCQGRLKDGDNRLIAGSILNGNIAEGPLAYLGRYHNQVSVLSEGRKKEFFGWISPGLSKFSLTRATLSFLRGKSPMPFNTAVHGGARGMMPIGVYERVMPLDILPTMLLRDILAGDTDGAQNLGCLELAEEDLALCSFVCPSKYEYGPALRQALTTIEKEG